MIVRQAQYNETAPRKLGAVSALADLQEMARKFARASNYSAVTLVWLLRFIVLPPSPPGERGAPAWSVRYGSALGQPGTVGLAA